MFDKATAVIPGLGLCKAVIVSQFIWQSDSLRCPLIPRTQARPYILVLLRWRSMVAHLGSVGYYFWPFAGAGGNRQTENGHGGMCL